MYSIGIDAGSKTIKLVVIDEKDNVVHYIYKQHSSNIQETLDVVIKEFISRYGDVRGCAAITGSAGIGIAEMLGLPFIQEVVATTDAVKSAYPAANAFVELGGEDAKVVYLDNPIEQRMNTTCAGGTGGFIDSVAALLGIKTSELEMYARRAEHVYPIAYRCAVYAQTDIRPLINSGASKEDIAASALEAVVKQTVSGLACGRPIRGKVIFLGGPLEYIPQLVQRFRLALGLNEKSGIKPHRANIFTARGAAIDARKPDSLTSENEGSNIVSLSQLLEMMRKQQVIRNDLGCFSPLFMNTGESEAFSKHHAAKAARHIPISQADGPLYLGIDVGSATIKQVLIDDGGNILDSDCRGVRGDIVNTAIVMLQDLYSSLPKNGAFIKRTVTTGQSDEIVKSALMADSSVVDVIAHVRAALSFEPEAEMVIDAGGQDVKIARISNGKITDTILNEPCSSGLGSFFDETARTFGYDIDTFSKKALIASRPVELDTKCTVFMTSRVRHAQKTGAGADNISAGIAYSIAQSILYRVLGHLGATALKGRKVNLQGRVFLSDAVVRAFETISGCEAVRPEEAQCMGALGASLIAREQAHDRSDGLSAEKDSSSTLAKPGLLKMLDPVYSAYGCKGCEEKCMLSLVDYGDERVFVSGNRCEGVSQILQEEYSRIEKGEHLGTVSLLPRSEHSKRSGAKDSELGGGIVIPGYLRSFSGGMVGGGGGVGGEWLKRGNVSGHWLRESFGGGKYSRRKSSGETYHREWTRHWGEDEKEIRP
ncbi:MAG: BadF/BadG/BcrA/BcrD ATPase family protein, partial [Coriobacteriales bacterium]